MLSRNQCKKAVITAICIFSMIFLINCEPTKVYAFAGYEFVVLSSYEQTMKIGDEGYLTYITSTWKKPSFSSSDSTVASVNTYGKITAKKAGEAIITAKIKNGEASCRILVEPTVITLSKTSLSLENGYTASLSAEVSTGHPVKWKSSKTSVAVINEAGVITAKKPGTTTITATADKTSVSCEVTVKSPKVTISRASASLYRTDTIQLSATSTSKSIPKWKSNRKSVAIVDEHGKVTAIKNGVATITVTVDGVSQICTVTVKKPEVTCEEAEITLKQGKSKTLEVTVSSGNKPEFSSSNEDIVKVNQSGKITAVKSGKAYIYAKEDGARVKVRVIVEKEK